MGNQPPHGAGGVAPPLKCSRLLRYPDPASRCPNDATYHVFWSAEGDNGLVCDDHFEEIRLQRWVTYAIHAYDPVCSMAGAVFVHAENRCVMNEGLLGLGAEEKTGELASVGG